MSSSHGEIHFFILFWKGQKGQRRVIIEPYWPLNWCDIHTRKMLRQQFNIGMTRTWNDTWERNMTMFRVWFVLVDKCSWICVSSFIFPRPHSLRFSQVSTVDDVSGLWEHNRFLHYCFSMRCKSIFLIEFIQSPQVNILALQICAVKLVVNAWFREVLPEEKQ